MAYDERLAQRVRMALAPRRDVEEKRMFGGVAFMVTGHMAVGVSKDRLLVRVDPADGESWLKEKDVHPMTFTGKPMKAFLFVAAPAVARSPGVKKWVTRALAAVAKLPAKSAKRSSKARKR